MTIASDSPVPSGKPDARALQTIGNLLWKCGSWCPGAFGLAFFLVDVIWVAGFALVVLDRSRHWSGFMSVEPGTPTAKSSLFVLWGVVACLSIGATAALVSRRRLAALRTLRNAEPGFSGKDRKLLIAAVAAAIREQPPVLPDGAPPLLPLGEREPLGGLELARTHERFIVGADFLGLLFPALAIGFNLHRQLLPWGIGIGIAGLIWTALALRRSGLGSAGASSVICEPGAVEVSSGPRAIRFERGRDAMIVIWRSHRLARIIFASTLGDLRLVELPRSAAQWAVMAWNSRQGEG